MKDTEVKLTLLASALLDLSGSLALGGGLRHDD
jgi:hypothetical protein